jgi:hypothetical protein
MRPVAVVALLAGLFVWMGFNAMAAQWSAQVPENPITPLPMAQSATYPGWDFQIHNRGDPFSWDAPMLAMHGPDCAPPPATHQLSTLGNAVFACRNHIMTAANAGGYGEIMLTPNQLLNCSAGCVVQWNQSTHRMSTRDWPDLWLTPWDDNLALPIEEFLPDLQGGPRRGIHVGAQPGNNSWTVATISNYQPAGLPTVWWVGMHEGVLPDIDQDAVRQTFRLTITPGHVKFERLASASATQFTWVDADCTCLLASDYVVQWGHHSYTPEKDGAGVPATWHWSDFTLSDAAPFTLIHATPRAVTENDQVITFAQPAPQQAYLRFGGQCKVSLSYNGGGTFNLVSPQKPTGALEHVNSYFVPIPAGTANVVVRFSADGWYGGPCRVTDAAVWSRSGSVIPTPTPVVQPTATPFVPTPTPGLPTATPTPPSGILVTFEPLVGQDRLLNGQYPTGLINWGNNKWWLAAPWGPHGTKSISFDSGNGTSRTFVFVSPRVLVSLKAGGVSPSTITLTCAGNAPKVQAIPANTLTTIATGWAVPCTTVTVGSSNGWDTNFDDLLVQ